MTTPKCQCGSKLKIICPICDNEDIMLIDTEEELFERVPVGWQTVPWPGPEENVPPYRVCSDECREKLMKIPPFNTDGYFIEK